MLTAYLLGMRAGEVISLTWDRVDLHEGVIDLSAEDTKTGEPRLIYLNALPERRKVFAEAALKQTKAQELVFTNADGDPIPKCGFRKPFLKACKLAETEITRRFYEHWLPRDGGEARPVDILSVKSPM